MASGNHTSYHITNPCMSNALGDSCPFYESGRIGGINTATRQTLKEPPVKLNPPGAAFRGLDPMIKTSASYFRHGFAPLLFILSCPLLGI